jgi:hypothetical protein
MARAEYEFTTKDEMKMILNRHKDKKWLTGYLEGSRKRDNWKPLDGKLCVAYATNFLNLL